MIRDYVALDLETSGLNPSENQIIEIGMAKVCDGEITETYSRLLNPKEKLSQRIVELTGITDEMVQKKREQILDVTQEDIRALADILESILKTGAFCVIGNEQQIEADKNMFKEVKELFH